MVLELGRGAERRDKEPKGYPKGRPKGQPRGRPRCRPQGSQGAKRQAVVLRGRQRGLGVNQGGWPRGTAGGSGAKRLAELPRCR